MTAPARLLALRLHGFKSFAERTNVEFGAGISAVVGPNGSGKSNLADALRWALGEQGRALRSRKAEDVIWAGSERRAAQGMADVTLVVDNADGLIPVDYQVLELGRRLFRSGENEYLLNRQRIRLRDLVDLLDSAHLADNAFLFIGQGMVDQALALRPEERRPLFEEVAGVRRHERRRRRAEDQLAESEANLARVQDILVELRPQVRRLAAQAEQQTTRRSAGEELADALMAVAHARWHEAARRLAEAESAKGRALAQVDAALAAQATAEESAAEIASTLEARATRERDLAATHEAARAALVDLRLQEARLAAEVAAADRDRARLGDERATAEADRERARRVLAAPEPGRDGGLGGALADAERALSDAIAQLAELRATTRAHGEELAAVRRAEAARATEVEAARRRRADVERQIAEEDQRVASLQLRVAELTSRAEAARAAAAHAADEEGRSRGAAEAARAEVDRLDGSRAAVADRLAAASQGLAGARGRLDALERRIAADAERGIARAARRRGGRQVDADLLVDASLRAAVEAALASTHRAYVVGRDAVPSLAGESGALVVGDRLDPAEAPTPADDRRCRERVADLGGGFLADAVRRDGSGAVRRLLSRAAWLPDLDACLRVQPDLAPGWVAVVRDGSAVVGELVVELGRPDGALDRQAEAERLRTEVAGAERDLDRLRDEVAGLERDIAAARASLAEARSGERAAALAVREAEHAERAAARDLEGLARELGWHEASRDRLRAESSRLADAVGSAEAADALQDGRPRPGPTVGAAPEAAGGTAGAEDATAAIASWEARSAEMRARRDRLMADVAAQDRLARTALDERARAAAAVAAADERIERADTEAARLADRGRDLAIELEAVRDRLAHAGPREEQARTALDALRAEDRDDRQRLASADAAAAQARERLRVAEDRSRAADRVDLEARLALDAMREQIVVELAALGELGLRRLAEIGGSGAGSALGPVLDAEPSGPRDTATDGADGTDDAGDPDVAALEAALEAAARTWTAETPAGEPPGPGRLATLRRRYHELGTPNPYAVDEYAAMRLRFEGLEAQEADLRGAIGSTRELIGELNALIATQFRTTFASLEVAFDARFRQLFGGGFARLVLTDPDDLSTTGVEIVARPPGKKPQALAMLSGGERALTAVALLFAMLTVRPVPFCVLDEVDAALDEANIGRFVEALRQLAASTQFVVITHNRGTIESADALYGVTVGDDSVSRVISLRLDEAHALAERSTNGSRATEDAERVAG